MFYFSEIEAVRSMQQIRKAASSADRDPEPKKLRQHREGGQCVTVMDVLPQMQAGSDATKLHPQTPFTAYVPSFSTKTVIAMVHFRHVARLLCYMVDLLFHSIV